jgi:hypothetical protein
MPQRSCQYIDLHPCQLEALELGARAISWAPRGPWNEISCEVDEVLTPSQLVDLARWARHFYPEIGAVSDVHDIFWERGVRFDATFSAKQNPEVSWKQVSANVEGTCDYASRMMLRQKGWAIELVVSDVYRCDAQEVMRGRLREELEELEWLDVINLLSQMRVVVRHLLEALETEEYAGLMFESWNVTAQHTGPEGP